MSAPSTQADDRRDLRFVLAAMAFVLAWMLVNSHFETGWVSAVALCLLTTMATMIYVLRTENALLGKFLLFGLAAGACELFADAWLVTRTKTLYYEHHEPRLVDSPVYMPLAWAVVLLQIGYLGYRVAQRRGLGPATLMSGVIGGLLIPFYESSAKGAGWWYYCDARHMLGNAPYYIILGEALLALGLPFLLRECSRREFNWALPIGILMGAWIWASYAVAFWLVG